MGKYGSALSNDEKLQRPYSVPHPRQYLENGIWDSVALALAPIEWRQKLLELSRVYDAMNWEVESGRAEGRVRFRAESKFLSGREKKAVRNWVERKKLGFIPLTLTLDGFYSKSCVLSLEYGLLPIVSLAEVPADLKRAYIYRFASADRDEYFRLGWRRKDSERHDPDVEKIWDEL